MLFRPIFALLKRSLQEWECEDKYNGYISKINKMNRNLSRKKQNVLSRGVFSSPRFRVVLELFLAAYSVKFMLNLRTTFCIATKKPDLDITGHLAF